MNEQKTSTPEPSADTVESRRVQAAGELYDQLEYLAALTRRINEQQHSAMAVSAEDWALLYQVTNAAQGLLGRIQKGE